MAETEPTRKLDDSALAEPQGMIDDRGELPTWELFDPQSASSEAAALASLPAAEEDRLQRRRSGARWGAVGLVGGLAGVLIGVVAQFAFGSGPGLVGALVVAVVSIVLIVMGYLRFWASGRN